MGLFDKAKKGLKKAAKTATGKTGRRAAAALIPGVGPAMAARKVAGKLGIGGKKAKKLSRMEQLAQRLASRGPGKTIPLGGDRTPRGRIPGQMPDKPKRGPKKPKIGRTFKSTKGPKKLSKMFRRISRSPVPRAGGRTLRDRVLGTGFPRKGGSKKGRTGRPMLPKPRLEQLKRSRRKK